MSPARAPTHTLVRANTLEINAALSRFDQATVLVGSQYAHDG